jgi:hypothetical protein
MTWFMRGMRKTKQGRKTRRFLLETALSMCGCVICGRRLVDVESKVEDDVEYGLFEDRCESHMTCDITTGRPDGYICAKCVGKIETVEE